MNKEFRYHPVIDGLKVNEDGTEVLLNGNKLTIKEFYVAETKRVRRNVNFLSRNITITRLVCECFHGLAENKGLSATLIDPTKGDHYTNIYWAKRGMKINPIRHRKVTEENHKEIQERLASGEKMKDIIKDFPFTNATYCIYKRLYGKKEK
ncbi:hypothetical protein [Faecalibacter macacae]|uniref:Uncharacterized protein n=1 Tax=Faecalibacter macacae TaxID=1859289 RepID=A0A3L9M5R0_9FLAO|nr:hypothetical protein [Faecalibacter macacae]RLZ08567.1 hypothetical protein EAH69_09640 [Faecalibacter macacae]